MRSRIETEPCAPVVRFPKAGFEPSTRHGREIAEERNAKICEVCEETRFKAELSGEPQLDPHRT
jgi:hypothetical protein